MTWHRKEGRGICKTCPLDIVIARGETTPRSGAHRSGGGRVPPWGMATTCLRQAPDPAKLASEEEGGAVVGVGVVGVMR